MRSVRRVDETDTLSAAEIDDFSVRQYPRRSIREIVERYQAAGLTVRGRRLRCDREPFIHRAALVGLEMAECDPTQAFGRHDAAQCAAIDSKHFSQTGVEHQRLVAENEELIEGKAGGGRNVRHIA